MDHDRQDASTPATRCAAGITPVAVSLSNAPPTALICDGPSISSNKLCIPTVDNDGCACWSPPSNNVAALEAYNPALMSAEPSTDGQQQ